MSEADDPTLADLLAQIQVYLRELIDLRRTDTEATLLKVRLLAAAAVYFNVLSVTYSGGRGGSPRAPGLVEQVVAAAFRSYAGEDPHADHFEKAAMLLRGITQGHPFNDGNKRTGFLLAAYYLQRVGHPWPPLLPVDEVVEFCPRVSAGEIRQVDDIAAELRRLWGRAPL